MSTTKTIKGRIAPKHDIEANWLKATNFIPVNGEFIVYNKEKDGDLLPDGRTVKIEYDRIKIGDGITNVNDLPFLITETEGVGRKTEEGGEIFNDYENNKATG